MLWTKLLEYIRIVAVDESMEADRFSHQSVKNQRRQTLVGYVARAIRTKGFPKKKRKKTWRGEEFSLAGLLQLKGILLQNMELKKHHSLIIHDSGDGMVLGGWKSVCVCVGGWPFRSS